MVALGELSKEDQEAQAGPSVLDMDPEAQVVTSQELLILNVNEIRKATVFVNVTGLFNFHPYPLFYQYHSELAYRR